jgi:hypothetical protein
MASLLRQMQSKAAVATEIASKRSSAFYKQLMEDNKHYVVEPATVQKCQELSKQLFYTRLARSVPAIPLSRVQDSFPYPLLGSSLLLFHFPSFSLSGFAFSLSGLFTFLLW